MIETLKEIPSIAQIIVLLFAGFWLSEFTHFVFLNILRSNKTRLPESVREQQKDIEKMSRYMLMGVFFVLAAWTFFTYF